jgi:hypothetical protein
MGVNTELERMCKEASVVWFKVLSSYLPGDTRKSPKNLDQVTRCSGRDSNRAPPKNKSGAILREALTWSHKRVLFTIWTAPMNVSIHRRQSQNKHTVYNFLNQLTSMTRYVRITGGPVPCFESTRTLLAQAISSALLVQLSSEYNWWPCTLFRVH